jgi:hypothetical protein
VGAWSGENGIGDPSDAGTYKIIVCRACALRVLPFSPPSYFQVNQALIHSNQIILSFYQFCLYGPFVYIKGSKGALSVVFYFSFKLEG